MVGVQWCIATRCKLLGIEAPKRVDVTSAGEKIEFKGFKFLPYTNWRANNMKVGQKILSVSADGFEELRRLGLLRYNAGRDIEIYDYYLSEVDITGSRMQAQTNCAMRYNLSEKAIQVIVYGFESRLRGV